MNIGKPVRWTIFSDGSHTQASLDTLRSIPSVFVKELNNNVFPPGYDTDSNPLLKKVFYYQTIDITITTVFVDSDVLFYKPFRKFVPVLKNFNWFLVDENYGYLDKTYLQKNRFDIYPCNSGFLVFNAKPDWTTVLSYLEAQHKEEGGLQGWSEQTAFHVLTRDFTTMVPLDPRYFIVDGSDSFKYSADFDYEKIALRHFVGPIRHKMWQYPWKKVLGFEY
jgi:hypothetical protein